MVPFPWISMVLSPWISMVLSPWISLDLAAPIGPRHPPFVTLGDTGNLPCGQIVKTVPTVTQNPHSNPARGMIVDLDPRLDGG